MTARPRAKILSFVASAALLTSLLIGCDLTAESPVKSDEVEGHKTLPSTPYTVWLSELKLTGYELSNRLKADENAANEICQQDRKQPAGYTTHFSLVSTPDYDRLNAIERYGLDPSLAVTRDGTHAVLAPKLGELLAQTGEVSTPTAGASSLVVLSMSKNGRFAGYCESESDYTTAMESDYKESLATFSTRCMNEGRVVCMSVR